jgi:4'-phosphopantetheinyl transferase
MFFRHWVGKESIMKAQGTGLIFPLDRCELAMSDTSDEAVINGRCQMNHEQKWLVRFLALEPGWVGAVAAEGSDWIITYCG